MRYASCYFPWPSKCMTSRIMFSFEARTEVPKGDQSRTTSWVDCKLLMLRFPFHLIPCRASPSFCSDQGLVINPQIRLSACSACQRILTTAIELSIAEASPRQG
jgi:hypothetical protein